MIDYNEVKLTRPKPPSLNQYYAGRHWTVRTKNKDSYWKHIGKELDLLDHFHMERFSVSVRYNCRYDVDNAIVCAKFLADYLRKNGYVDDDTPKYFISQKTQYDSEVEKDTFVVTIKCYGYKTTQNEQETT